MFTLDELCVEVIGKCLMNCRHCSSSCSKTNESILSYESILTILDDARRLGTKTLEISGGEPLLHPRILDIIREAKKYFEVRLYTSGYLGNKEGITTSLVSSLVDLGLDRIVFNVQGATADTHDRITMTRGSFESVMTSIKRITSVGLWTGVHFVPMIPNYKEIAAISELCNEIGVDRLAILRFVSQGRGSINTNELELSLESFHSIILDVVREKKKYDRLQIRTGCPMNFCSLVDSDIKPVNCKAGKSTLLINFDGKVIPCPAFKETAEFKIGNIYFETLLEIWTHNPILQLLRNFDFTQIENCNRCHNLEHCRGRCVAQRFYKFGTINQGPDPMCPYQNEFPITARKENCLMCSVK